MPSSWAAGIRLLAAGALCCCILVPRNLAPYTEISPAAFAVFCSSAFAFGGRLLLSQIAQPLEHPGDVQHHGHQMNIPMGEEQCVPQYTYEDGPRGPSHWLGVCTVGRMQAPIDIRKPQKLPINNLRFVYKPVDLDVINDCNQYRVLVRFPDNHWLRIGKRGYFLSELHFRQPGENAVDGKRPQMSIQFLHLSAESEFVMIEVPVVEGKENAAFQTVLDHIPAPGKEIKMKDVKFDPMELLPADRTFYRFPGSLTTSPFCNEGVTWYVMKNPVEFSAAQIAAYKNHYHDTARPLQPLDSRPVAVSQ